MLKNRMAIGCLAVSLFWAAGAGWAGAGGRPVLVAAETRYDFGKVIEGTTVSHEFVIANNGTAPLTIVKIESG